MFNKNCSMNNAREKCRVQQTLKLKKKLKQVKALTY